MRKLLIMASLFYPQKKGGGPAVSIMNVVQAIKGEFEITVISKNHEVGSDEKLPGIEQGWKDYDFGKVYYFNHGDHTVRNVYNLICEIKPDVIYQNSFFSYDDLFPVLRYKKKHKNVGVVIAPRGEVCENRFADGKSKKSLYVYALKICGLLKNVYYQATGNDELVDIQRKLKVDSKYIFNINNFSYANENDQCVIKKVPGELKLCFIARIQDTKNLLYAIERLRALQGKIQYDVYGPIENKEYYEKCFAVTVPSNVSVKYCGLVEHDMIGKTVTKYHAYYMPTIGENYGHSIVEAMLYSRPVVISDMTPWTSINDSNAGYAVPLEDPEQFEDALNVLCGMDDEQYQEMCKSSKNYITDRLKTEEIIAQYIKCFNEV